MKQINLVPAAVRQKAATRQAVPYLFLAVLFGLGAAGAAWVGFRVQVQALQSEQERLVQAEADRQSLLAKELADLKIGPDLRNRVDALNTLSKTDLDWGKVFPYVAGLLPKDITVSTLSIATAQGVPTVKLTAEAPSNVSYATFAEFLKEKKGTAITAFTVDGYTYSATDGRVLFTMTLQLPVTELTYKK